MAINEGDENLETKKREVRQGNATMLCFSLDGGMSFEVRLRSNQTKTKKNEKKSGFLLAT